MDSKFAVCFLLLLLSSTLFITIQAVQPYEQKTEPKASGINVAFVSGLLSDKGYHAMSLTLDIVLEAVIMPTHNNTTLTLFCPQDQAFFKSKYPQPPLTLLRYHVVPFKMDKDTMGASFDHGFKVDTLLPGHPLVATSLPGTTGRYASLNLVKVTDWDVYNDGRLIVHGVEDFFDPAYQTLRYPQYDVMKVEEVPSWVALLKGALETMSWFILLGLVFLFAYVLIRSFLASNKPYEDGEYAPLH